MGQHTPGPWDSGHFVDDSISCNCRSITAEAYMGGICTIEVNNGKRVGDGGNDCPPLEEAKANSRLIAAAPELLEELKSLVNWLDENKRSFHGDFSMADILTEPRSVIAKAEGR